MPRLMQQVMHKCTDMMLVCQWQGEDIPCFKLFKIWRSTSGYCCSFNARRIDEQL